MHELINQILGNLGKQELAGRRWKKVLSVLVFPELKIPNLKQPNPPKTAQILIFI